MKQVLPPDGGRKGLYDKAAPAVPKHLRPDGSVSVPGVPSLGEQVLPPDSRRAEQWAAAPMIPDKILLPDGSVYDGYGSERPSGESSVGDIGGIISLSETEPDPDKVLFWYSPVRKK